MIIAAGEFKAKCLHLMDKVNEDHEEIIISKRGQLVAKLIPIKSIPEKSIFGLLKDTVTKENNIVAPVGEKWNAD